MNNNILYDIRNYYDAICIELVLMAHAYEIGNDSSALYHYNNANKLMDIYITLED